MVSAAPHFLLLSRHRFGNWPATRLSLRMVEVPVRQRRRIGTSKVSGALKVALGAGNKILWAILKCW